MAAEKYDDQILNICKQYEQSKIYSMIKERVEFLVNQAEDKQAMIDYLMDTSINYCKDDPLHMLGTLNLLKMLL